MSRVSEICSKVGRGRIADALGVSKAAVSNAVADNKFPASWYPGVRDLCAEAKVNCPEGLFNWKSPASAPSQEAS